MLNWIWALMIIIGIVYGAFHGTLDGVEQGLLDGGKEAVTLAVSMAGIMGLWCGLMEIARQSGLLHSLQKGCRPIINWMFPHIPKEDPVREHIAANLIANFFGLGNAATPAGLQAMQGLERLEEERRREMGEKEQFRKKIKSAVPKGTANYEMCTLLVVNISSLQLLPVTMLAYRSQYGSVNPSAIVGAAIVATTISTVAGILFCKLMGKKEF